MLRRLTALLLALTLLMSAASTFADQMSVSFTCSHSGNVPTGTELIFTVTGINTAAVALVVIPPSSIPVTLYGNEVRYIPTVPGPYLFVAYGVNTTDDEDPNKQLCMSRYQSMEVTGTALPPQQLSAEMDMQGETREGLESLMGQTLYLDKNIPSIDLYVTLDAAVLPQDTQITVTLINDEGDRAVLLHAPVDGQRNWDFHSVQAVKDWFRPAHAEPVYGRFKLEAEILLTAQDYEDASYHTTFFVDTYTNEMRYVNQFIHRGSYLNNSNGQALDKWLDMSRRSDSDRIRSGYLMLESEYEYQHEAFHSFHNMFIDAGTFVLDVIGSWGLSLVVSPFISSLTNKELREKFGEKGEKVYPYYAQLASVYEDYVNDLLSSLTDLTLSHALLEDISSKTAIYEIVDRTSGVVDASQPYIVAYIADKTETNKGWQLHLRMSEKDVSHKWILESLDTADDGQVLFNLLDWTGAHHTMTLGELADDLVGSTAMNLFIADNVAKEVPPEDLVLAIRAYVSDKKGPTVQATNAYQNKLKNFKPEKAVEVDIEPEIPKRLQASLNVDLGQIGVRKVHYTLSASEILDLKLYDQLNEYEQSLFSRYRYQVDKALDQVPGRSYGDVAGTAIESILLLANAWQYGAQRSAQEDLQLAYFNTICQVEEEYVQMLETWRDSLSDTKASKREGVEDPELMQRAINALINDIRASRNSMLTSLATENTEMFTSRQFYTLAIDAMKLAADSAFKYLPCHINVQAKLAQVAAKGVDAVRTSLASITKAAGSKFNSTLLTNMSNKLTASVTAHSGASIIANLAKSSNYAAVGSLVATLIAGKMQTFTENVSIMYSMKKSLESSLRDELSAYGTSPTHQRAVDIIEGLRMMKALKYSGEELVITQTLGRLYEALDLEQGNLLAALWNELRLSNGASLNAQDHVSQVYLIFEPVTLGTVKELKDENKGLKFESSSFVNNKDTALGQQILGVYANPSDGEVLFQGQSLEPLPADWLGPNGLNNMRDDALGISKDDYAWVKDHMQLHPDWPNVSSQTIEHQINYTNSHWYESRALYSREGLELFLTWDEYRTYLNAQDTINEILSTYDDSYDFKAWQKYSLNDMSEGLQSQYQQRIVLYLLTMKYIDSLKQYDPAILYY